MLIRLLTALTFLIYASTAAFAQSSPVTQNAPEISLRGDDDLGTFDQTGLILEKLNISVDIHAGLAQISLGATLRNETEDQVEASFAYPLPKGAVINGYALDLDGELVDGVLMPKERAEALYTDRVTQSIDPGIAARTVDNRYKTRIYPIEEEGGRRSIRLDFTAPVPAGGLRLPLASDAPVEQVSLNITGDGAELAKTPITGSTATDTVLSGDIFIPAVAAEAALSEHKGQTLLTVPLTEKTSEKMAATTQGVQSIAVIWDTSLSRMENDLAAERRFVSAVLADLSLQKQSLIYGADRAEFAARYETPAQLDAAIGRLTYDGATNLSALLDVETLSRPDIDADICLDKAVCRPCLAASLPLAPQKTQTRIGCRSWLRAIMGRIYRASARAMLRGASGKAAGCSLRPVNLAKSCLLEIAIGLSRLSMKTHAALRLISKIQAKALAFGS